MKTWGYVCDVATEMSERRERFDEQRQCERSNRLLLSEDRCKRWIHGEGNHCIEYSNKNINENQTGCEPGIIEESLQDGRHLRRHHLRQLELWRVE